MHIVIIDCYFVGIFDFFLLGISWEKTESIHFFFQKKGW